MRAVLDDPAVLAPEPGERGLPDSRSGDVQQTGSWDNLKLGLAAYHCPRLPLVTPHGGRIRPGLAVYVCPRGDVRPGAPARRTRGDMVTVRQQLWININVPGSRWQRIRVTIAQRAVIVIGLGGPAPLDKIPVNDGVAQRRVRDRAATEISTAGVAGNRAIYERPTRRSRAALIGDVLYNRTVHQVTPPGAAPAAKVRHVT